MYSHTLHIATICQVCPRSVPKLGTPTPPYTPRGYKFLLKPYRLFLTCLKSTSVENFGKNILD